MKAADVADTTFLQKVTNALARTEWDTTTRMAVELELPEVPPKVLLAKARTLIRRGLLDGCYCGCRGDYRLTDAGAELLIEHQAGRCPGCGHAKAAHGAAHCAAPGCTCMGPLWPGLCHPDP